jgi:hypothetical protein
LARPPTWEDIRPAQPLIATNPNNKIARGNFPLILFMRLLVILNTCFEFKGGEYTFQLTLGEMKAIAKTANKP